MASDTIDLLSPYRPEECARRLRLVTDPKRLFAGKNPLIGSISEASLSIRRRLGYKNSFQTFLFADMTVEGAGTRLRCRFGMHPLAVAFLSIWFSFVVIGLGIGLFVAFNPFGIQHGLRPLWPAAIVPVFMAVFAYVWLKLSRRLAHEDEAFMIEFLRFSLDAEPDAVSAHRLPSGTR